MTAVPLFWDTNMNLKKLHRCKCNRPFPSCPQSLFQDESLLLISVSIHIEIRTKYNNKNFALGLALKERFRGTRKWSI